MNEDKRAMLVERLAAKTALDKVAWEKTVTEGVYRAAFAQNVIDILTRMRDDDELQTQVTDVVLQIRDAGGSLVEEFRDIDIKLEPQPGAPNRHAYTVMHDMYLGARRRAMGVIKAMDNILEELG